MILFVDALLFSIAAILALIAATRGRTVLRDSAREGVLDFFKLMPRIMLGVIGAGYIAALLPQEVVGRWLGADSGAAGIAIAMIGGALTPGGPVIGFSIGAAALKGGAGTPQVIAYCTAWALFAVPRLFIWELGRTGWCGCESRRRGRCRFSPRSARCCWDGPKPLLLQLKIRLLAFSG